MLTKLDLILIKSRLHNKFIGIRKDQGLVALVLFAF